MPIYRATLLQKYKFIQYKPPIVVDLCGSIETLFQFYFKIFPIDLFS